VIISINGWTIAFLITLFLFIGTTLFLVRYIRQILKQLMFVSDNLKGLNNEVVSFTSHLRSLYKMEMFYGDETLKGLVKHAMLLIEEIEKFDYLMDLTDQVPANYTEDEEEDPEDKLMKELLDEESEVPKELFYAGSRRSNT
jgi:hypothetical protein